MIKNYPKDTFLLKEEEEKYKKIKRNKPIKKKSRTKS